MDAVTPLPPLALSELRDAGRARQLEPGRWRVAPNAAARRSVRAVVAASALLWVVVLSTVAVRHYNGDLRALVQVGAPFRHPPALADVPQSHLGPLGYDGQCYAALATDPFLLDPATPGYLDLPFYRAGRVGISLVAWLLAGGSDVAAVALYQVLCWALGLLGVWVAARWLMEEGRSPLWALPLVVSGGIVSSMLSTLPDAAAGSLILLALWLHKNGRRGVLPVLVLAGLTRETSVLAAAALAASEIGARRFRSAAAFVFIPLLVVIGWRVWLLSRGLRPFVPEGVFSGPGAGLALIFARYWASLVIALVVALGVLGAHSRSWRTVAAGGALFLAACAAFVARYGLFQAVRSFAELATPAAVLLAFAAAFWLTRPWSAPMLTYVAFLALAAVMGPLVYEWSWNSTRALVILPLLAAVLAETQASSLRRNVLRAVPITLALVGLAMVTGEALRPIP